MVNLGMYHAACNMSYVAAQTSGREWNFYQKIANRTVQLAAEDYQKALCGCPDHDPPEASWQIQELEEFFTGSWFELLTDLDGRTLMERLRRECEEHKYNYPEIKKIHKHPEEEDYAD